MNVSSSGMESRGIGIVGLGYVGLPLAVAFAETGRAGDRLRPRPREGRGDQPRRELHRRRAVVEAGRASRARSAPTGDAAELAGLRGDHHLRADAADRLARARPLLPRGGRADARRRPARGTAGRARVDHLPRHHPRPARRRAGELGSRRSASDFHLAFSPERIDPGRTDFTVRTTPKLVGGMTPEMHRGGEARSTNGSATR